MIEREDIIRMAREAGIVVTGEAVWRLCELVAAAEREACLEMVGILVEAEREACAKVCEDGINSEQYPTLTEIAAAIRARGQA